MLKHVFAGLLVLALAASAACRTEEKGTTASPVVATIDGVPVPLSAFEAYRSVRFVEDGLEEPLAREDSERVLSRLFDDFVAESLLVVEADKRGVRVSDAEVAAWLGGETDADPVRAAERKEQARRELATRRLLDAWVRAETKAQAHDRSPDENTDDAAARLVASLRKRYEVRLHRDVLPFHYVPEGPATP